MSGIGFPHDTMLIKPDDAVEYADLLCMVLAEAQAGAFAEFEGTLEVCFVPFELLVDGKGDEVVFVHDNGDVTFAVPECSRTRVCP